MIRLERSFLEIAECNSLAPLFRIAAKQLSSSLHTKAELTGQRCFVINLSKDSPYIGHEQKQKSVTIAAS